MTRKETNLKFGMPKPNACLVAATFSLHTEGGHLRESQQPSTWTGSGGGVAFSITSYLLPFRQAIAVTGPKLSPVPRFLRPILLLPPLNSVIDLRMQGVVLAISMQTSRVPAATTIQT
ncbi:hypothetical protein OIU84_021672 [Salix udensis]|uniref:Uncharacterized protein n=1 Tax=Salix udensis TaxID=889485 RepID=A0AAD6KV62_9ROSI|nr:hypothetical protein OIU84_021672 [Salix udensis]